MFGDFEEARQFVADRQIQMGDDNLIGAAKKPEPREDVAVHEDANLPRGLRESAAELHKVFEGGRSESSFGQTATHGNMVDMFGLATQPPTKEQIQEHKKFLDDYRSMIDPGWRPSAPDLHLHRRKPAPLAGKMLSPRSLSKG